jgi:hypothetical protein
MVLAFVSTLAICIVLHPHVHARRHRRLFVPLAEAVVFAMWLVRAVAHPRANAGEVLAAEARRTRT